MTRLVLASSSPYRRALLGRLQLPFEALAPQVDEAAVKAAGGEPAEIARELARSKALAVAATCDPGDAGYAVIGSDQVAALDHRVLDKPGDAAGAIAQLTALQGREHALLTAVAIATPDRLIEFLDVTRLCMRALAAAEIERYVAAEQPFDCAGSYRIEGLGIALFAAIDGEDQTAIVGLPLLRLAAELRQLGLAVP
ncbi:MAG: septum formation protein Maf [Planctomycetes bacterium]|nr:septum formation protein Maf [Planctomycetota bacterium]